MKYHALFVILEKALNLNCHLLQIIGGALRVNTFANRADPDQAALVRASWSGSAQFAYTTGPRSPVGNVSGNRCESGCRGRKFDPNPVPYFHGD